MSFGLHYSDTIQGRVFSQVTTPVGVIIPVYTTTTAGLTLPVLNPLGSNRNVELISVDVAFSSTSTGANPLAPIFLMGIPCGAGPATGANVTVFTGGVAPVNGLLGAGNGSKCLSSSGQATVTLNAAGVTIQPTATTTQAGPIRTIFSPNALTTTVPYTFPVIHYDFAGTVVIPPGWMVYMAALTAFAFSAALGIIWKEIPIVPSQG